MDKVSVMTEASVAQTNPIMQKVMQLLDESKSGNIDKK